MRISDKGFFYIKQLWQIYHSRLIRGLFKFITFNSQLYLAPNFQYFVPIIPFLGVKSLFLGWHGRASGARYQRKR